MARETQEAGGGCDQPRPQNLNQSQSRMCISTAIRRRGDSRIAPTVRGGTLWLKRRSTESPFLGKCSFHFGFSSGEKFRPGAGKERESQSIAERQPETGRLALELEQEALVRAHARRQPSSGSFLAPSVTWSTSWRLRPRVPGREADNPFPRQRLSSRPSRRGAQAVRPAWFRPQR